MAKSKKIVKKASVVSLRALCNKANIPHHQVYSNLNGIYGGLDGHPKDPNIKNKLANTFFEEVTPFLAKLGFYIKMYRIKDPVQ